MGGVGSGRIRKDTTRLVEESLRFSAEKLLRDLVGTEWQPQPMPDWLSYETFGWFGEFVITAHEHKNHPLVVGLQRRVATPTGWYRYPTQFFGLHPQWLPKGGKRWRLRCPGLAETGPCGRLVADIFVPRGSLILACRTCHRLRYRCQSVKAKDPFEKLDDVQLVALIDRTARRALDDRASPSELLCQLQAYGRRPAARARRERFIWDFSYTMACVREAMAAVEEEGWTMPEDLARPLSDDPRVRHSLHPSHVEELEKFEAAHHAIMGKHWVSVEHRVRETEVERRKLADLMRRYGDVFALTL